MRPVFAWAILVFFCGGLRVAAVDAVLVAADDPTLQPVRQAMENPRHETTAAWTRWRGRLHGKDVVLVLSEGDPLNAVAAVTLAVRLHAPRLIVVFGTARAHAPSLQPGDAVVSERFCAFDGMISPVVPLGDGADALKWQKLPHPLMTAGERETPTEYFPADAAALEIALKLSPAHGRIIRGTLGSAHQVNREADRIARLRELWETTTEDGESAHVAGVAALFSIPVLGLRIVDGTPTDAAALALQFVARWK